MTILWSFSYNSFVKFHARKFGNHNMCYFQISFYNDVFKLFFYKGTELYLNYSI